jgi:DNA repair ATPase RecN
VIDTQMSTIEDVFTSQQKKFLLDNFVTRQEFYEAIDGIMWEFARMHERLDQIMDEIKIVNRKLDRLDYRVTELEKTAYAGSNQGKPTRF